MTLSRFSRRQLLSGLGAGVAGQALLPLLHTRPGWAAPQFPRRLIIMTWTEGAVERAFWPDDGGTWNQVGPKTEFPLEERHFEDKKANGDQNTLAPLKDFRRDLLILRGIDIMSGSDDPNNGSGHASYPHVLTGINKATKDHPGGPSLDQYVASALAKTNPTRLASIVAGVYTQHPAGIISEMCVSASGRGQYNFPENDPHRLFERVFGARGPMADPNAAHGQASRRTLMDHLGGELSRLSKRLGSEDRVKVEGHLEAVRQIERELAALPADAKPTCRAPDIGPPLPQPGAYYAESESDVKKAALYPQFGKLHMDQIVAAMACDQTRVALLQWSTNGATEVIPSWLGSEYVRPSPSGEFGRMLNLHEIAHGSTITGVGGNATGDGPFVKMKIRMDRWYVEQFAYLLGRLREVKEGDGTMLDNTAVLFINAYGSGGWHWNFHTPTIVAGNCQGYFSTGRYIRYPRTRDSQRHYFSCFNTPHNGLLVALANAVGVPTEVFGDPRYGSGDLPRLRKAGS